MRKKIFLFVGIVICIGLFFFSLEILHLPKILGYTFSGIIFAIISLYIRKFTSK